MNRECGMRNVDCGGRKANSRVVTQRTARTGSPLRRVATRLSPNSEFRNGVTLIELLITVTIIATLSAAFLGASRAAMEHARAARTKTTIAKIHTLLMEHWASYTTRRVDIDPDFERRAQSFSGVDRGQALADLRLLATRELMKLEIPDRWSDVLLDALPDGTVSVTTARGPAILANRPSLSTSYLRRLDQISQIADGETIRRNQGAECLYMIVMLATGDGEARTLFSEQDIGDTDGDGAQEFLDGWGRPIHFLRWPAGFVSSQIMSYDPTTLAFDSDADHDPFDHFRRDMFGSMGPSAEAYGGSLRARLRDVSGEFYTEQLRDDVGAYRLVPLIYSSGSDGISDINASPGYLTGLDPYAIDPDTNEFQFGLPGDVDGDGDENSLDNIHNHLQEGR